LEPKNFDVNKFIGDLSKSRKMLGYEPKTRLEDGLKILEERILTKTDLARGSG
jgi:nucleoside-diphosphate-sugar epimerase